MPGAASGQAADHEASLEYTYATTRRAAVVERSVRREVGEIEGDRAGAAVEREGRTVLVTVTATDLVALRAGLNTWQGLVDVAESSGGAAADSGTAGRE